MSRNDISRFPFEFSELALTEFSNKLKSTELGVEEQKQLYLLLQQTLTETCDRMFSSLEGRITHFQEEVAQTAPSKSR